MKSKRPQSRTKKPPKFLVTIVMNTGIGSYVHSTRTMQHADYGEYPPHPSSKKRPIKVAKIFGMGE